MTAPRYHTGMDAADWPRRAPAAAPLDELPLFAPAPEPDRTDEEAAKARVLAAHEDRHGALLDRMRQHARSVHRRTGRPVSVNDVREIIEEERRAGREVDRRLAGQVFAGKGWRRVGTVETTADGATAARVGVARSAVGAYVPVEDEG